jgi:hypothetical protein
VGNQEGKRQKRRPGRKELDERTNEINERADKAKDEETKDMIHY